MINETVPKEIPFGMDKWHKDLKLWLGNPMPNGEVMKNKRLLLPEGLEFKQLSTKDMQNKPTFIAIDTETFASNGNLMCLCNSKNEKTIYGTADQLPDLKEIIKYLHNLVENKNTYFVAWNLKFDATVILKCFPNHKDLKEFYYGEDGEKYIYEKDGLKITYLFKKSLSLKYKTNSVVIYDAMQFYGGSLDSVANRVLGKQKEYKGKYQDKKFPDKLTKKELAEIVEYCQLDCSLTEQLIIRWVDAFQKNFGFYPNAFYSAGYLGSQIIKSTLDTFPNFRKIPYAVQKLAYQSYFGGRFEITERGRLKNIHHYDINSAYPYAMTLMPDFEKGKWIRIKTLDQWRKHKKYVGFYKIDHTSFEKNVSPFMYRGVHGQVYAPQGRFTTYVTSFELEASLNYDIEIHRIEGFCFIPGKRGKTKFNKLIQSMYDKRLQQKDADQKLVYKILVNSVYGKFAQAKPEPKNLFNPVMCAAITGKCRAMLLDAAKDNKEDIIMFATDGIFSKKPLKNLEKTTGKKVLGEWEKEFHPDFILIMAGIYSHNNKEKRKLETKTRGFGLRIFTEKGKPLVFDLDSYTLEYDKKKESYFYNIYTQMPVALSQAVIQHKYSKKDVGKFQLIKKEIDINGDHKREWNNVLTIPDEHCTSTTIKI